MGTYFVSAPPLSPGGTTMMPRDKSPCLQGTYTTVLTTLPSSYLTTSYASIPPHLCAVLGLRMSDGSPNQTCTCRVSVLDPVKINHDSNLPCEFQGLPSLQKIASGRSELWLNQLILGNEVNSLSLLFVLTG